MQDFRGVTFSTLFDSLNNFHSCPDLEFWRARQQNTESEPTATTYRSLKDKEDGYNDNYISRELLCGTGHVNQKTSPYETL